MTMYTYDKHILKGFDVEKYSTCILHVIFLISDGSECCSRPIVVEVYQQTSLSRGGMDDHGYGFYFHGAERRSLMDRRGTSYAKSLCFTTWWIQANTKVGHSL